MFGKLFVIRCRKPPTVDHPHHNVTLLHVHVQLTIYNGCFEYHLQTTLTDVVCHFITDSEVAANAG